MASKFTAADTGEGKNVCTGCITGGCGCTVDAEFGTVCEGGWWRLEPDDVLPGAELTGAGKGSFVAAAAPFIGRGD
jgi:hypothetical protein